MVITEEQKSTEQEVILLNDGSIKGWEKPPKPGWMRMDMFLIFDGLTTIVESIGIRKLDMGVEDYQVMASAAVYLADIARINKYKFLKSGQPPTNPIQREILFSGGIEVYQLGLIPGTQIQGAYLDAFGHGRIWTAIPSELRAKIGDENLFKFAIFGESFENPNPKKVEAILRGYEQQKTNERNAQSRASFNEYQRGRLDQQEHGGLDFP